MFLMVVFLKEFCAVKVVYEEEKVNFFVEGVVVVDDI